MTPPNVPQKAPYVRDEEPGPKAWCACGLSANQPYCDGSHKTTELRPVVVELTEAKRVAWCGCKQSGNAPYCDGSHKSL
ncbi:CDGSH iron-sulfur domain-containing protein [Candidatus Poribacteria bacterium]|nr:CDGSH iron-sulfur domain-containing protein [Candidatus Poribacteria bacterium]